MIIGASRGIGLELARQYVADGWRVHATTRTLRKPGPLRALGENLVLHGLDVCNEGQIAALAEALSNEGLDVLIHNAGVMGTGMSREDVMRVNAQAPIQVAKAMLNAVTRGEQKKLVLMTSQMGARRGRTGTLGTYGDSKAALNDKFRELAPGWHRQGVTAIVMHPGWVRTDMGGAGAPLSVEESVSGIRKVIAQLTRAHHGHFMTWDGREHPW